MRGIRGHGQVITEAKIIATALFVSLFVIFIFPVAAHAQAAPPIDTTTETPIDETPEVVDEETEPAEPAVQAPGTPVATSPDDDRDIVWEWTPPENGVTPDAPVAEPTDPVEQPADPSTPPTEPVEPVIVERPTDIIKYGYELTNQGVVVTSGEVESNVNTVTTQVSSNGDYVFKVWSITRDAQLSNPAEGYKTIVSPVPVIPSFPVIEVPAPIGAVPIEDVVAINNAPAVSSNTYPSSAAPSGYIFNEFPPSADVLSDSDTGDSASPAETLAVVAPSNQGWVILGLPWYVWLLMAAIVYTAWRWFDTVAQNRE